MNEIRADRLRHLRLWRRFIVQAFVRDTHYRVHFLTTVGVGIVQLGLTLIPVWLLFGYTDSVRGWSRSEVIALVGIYQMVTGILATFVAPNLSRMTSYITDGELDGVLLRPVSGQFYLTFRWVNLAELGSVVTGALVLALGLVRSGVTPDPFGVVRAAALIGCGLVLLTCAWSALVFLAFWLQSVGPITEVFNAVVEAGRYPLAFFPTLVRGFLTFVFPVAFATTLPVQELSGTAGWVPVLAGIGFSGIAIYAIRAFWRIGLRSYASASS
jgi:ABC-2 type transport system permease protein